MTVKGDTPQRIFPMKMGRRRKVSQQTPKRLTGGRNENQREKRFFRVLINIYFFHACLSVPPFALRVCILQCGQVQRELTQSNGHIGSSDAVRGFSFLFFLFVSCRWIVVRPKTRQHQFVTRPKNTQRLFFFFFSCTIVF